MMLTLLTDFGTQDVYVGVMKGVIAKINPFLRITDLTHTIPPQDIASARFNLMTAVPHFPKGTVHVAVVDPGVGSHRRAIAIRCSDIGYLVAPDNGLISGVIDQLNDVQLSAVELTNSNYWYTSTPSNTFHGRDIFASVGAYLASGVSLEQLGSPISTDSLVRLPLAPVQVAETGIDGAVQYIDGFGNLVTTIPNSAVSNRDWLAYYKSAHIHSGKTYSTQSPGQILALTGSHGWIEIAVNGGSAALAMKAAVGDSIGVRW